MGIDWILVIAIIGVVITAASTAYSLYAQSEATAEANRYQDKLAAERDDQIESNYALAIKSANAQYRALQARQQQEGLAASEKEIAGAVRGAEARSTALLAAGEAGVSGLSVNALLDDFRAQETQYRESLRTNLNFSRDQLDAEMLGVNATAEGRIQAIRPYARQPVEEPSYIGGVMRVGGAALSAYEKYRAPSTQVSGGSDYTSSAAWSTQRAGERQAY